MVKMARFLFRTLGRYGTVSSKTPGCCECEPNMAERLSSTKFYGTRAEKKPADPPEDVFGDDDRDERRKEEKEKVFRNLKLEFFFVGASAVMFIGAGVCVLMVDNRYKRDGDENDPYPVRVYGRVRSAIGTLFESVRAPSYEKLLPDPLPYPYVQPPYTLILEMTDLLVHPEWTYATGWRFKKRPNVDRFLWEVAERYEVVVFTASNGFNVYPILDGLDKTGAIMYRLVKNATDYVDGHHVKNLDRINRDLSKVIVIDWNADSVKFQRENAFLIPRWTGDDDDQQLVRLAEFLNVVAASEVSDVRDVLSYYKQFDDPLEVFKDNQRKLLEMQEEQKRTSGTLPVNKARGSWKDRYLYGK